MWDIFKLKKAGIFAGGVLFGTAGVKILASDDAKKVYTNCTAAVLRAKDCVMKTATTDQENAEDILAEAQQINEAQGDIPYGQRRRRSQLGPGTQPYAVCRDGTRGLPQL